MLTGALTRWRMMLTCSRVFSTDSIAHGNDPSAPPCAAAITSSASITPAIGASTMGNSVLKRSSNLRSGHMAFARALGDGRASGGADEIAASEQSLLGLGDDTVDDLGCPANIMDQPDGFAGDDRGDIEIAGGLRRRIFGGDRVDVLHQLDFAADPAPRM